MTGSPFTLNFANLIAAADEYGLYERRVIGGRTEDIIIFRSHRCGHTDVA